MQFGLHKTVVQFYVDDASGWPGVPLPSISPVPAGQTETCWHRIAKWSVGEAALLSTRSLQRNPVLHSSGLPGLQPRSRRGPPSSQSNDPAGLPYWGIPHSSA